MRLVREIADLFDAVAPQSETGARAELVDAGLEPERIGRNLEQVARAALEASPTLPDAAPHAGTVATNEAEPGAGYDPFSRGPHPVGVRTLDLGSPGPLVVEVWYPASAEYSGLDLERSSRDRYALAPHLPRLPQDAVRDAALRQGSYPLVVFSHGSFAHRRQSTFLCTHLASHGYVVAAVDHAGNTIADLANGARLAGLTREPPEHIAQLIDELIAARVPAVRRVLDAILSGGAAELSGAIDPQRIGVSGHSFGGWTALAVTAIDPRIRAALPLAPGGASNPPPGTIRLPRIVDWVQDVPTLFLVADRDTATPLAGMRDLFERTLVSKRMVALCAADHFHFCDFVEQAHEMFRSSPGPGSSAWVRQAMPPIDDLCPGEHGYLFVRGLGLAHMDAHLKGNVDAAQLLARDLRAVMAEQGVEVEEILPRNFIATHPATLEP
jgi:dienelactone hydrolase